MISLFDLSNVLFVFLACVFCVRAIFDHHSANSNSYSSGPFLIRDVNYIYQRCERDYSCAAISFRHSVSEMARNENMYDVYIHGYLPNRPVFSKDSSWQTRQSHKSFTYHRIKVQDSLQQEVQFGDFKFLTIPEAEARCSNEKRSRCVGFSFFADDRSSNGELSAADAQNFQNEVDKRTNLNFYAELWKNDTAKFKISFLSQIQSVETSTINQTTPYLTAIRNFHVGENHESQLYIDEGKIILSNLFDPSGFCCHLDQLPSRKEVEDMDIIPRIPCTISKAKFHRSYVMKRKPVILLGCSLEWPANNLWKPQKFEKRFKNSTIFRAFHFTDDSELFFDFNEKAYSWRVIYETKIKNGLNESTGDHFYISQKIKERDQLFKEYMPPPQFSSPNDSLLNYVSDFRKKYYPYYFFYYGDKHSSSPLHTDFVHTDAWNCLLHGSKWWVIMPPSIQNDVSNYRCNNRCSTSIKGDSWFASIGQYIHNFKFSNGMYGHHVMQKAGETLYLPHEWKHTTLSMEESIAVSSGFLSNYQFENFWRSVVSIGSQAEQKSLYYTGLTKFQRQIVRNLGKHDFEIK